MLARAIFGHKQNLHSKSDILNKLLSKIYIHTSTIIYLWAIFRVHWLWFQCINELKNHLFHLADRAGDAKQLKPHGDSREQSWLWQSVAWWLWKLHLKPGISVVLKTQKQRLPLHQRKIYFLGIIGYHKSSQCPFGFDPRKRRDGQQTWESKPCHGTTCSGNGSRNVPNNFLWPTILSGWPIPIPSMSDWFDL